jgi:hypothetical protein
LTALQDNGNIDDVVKYPHSWEIVVARTNVYRYPHAYNEPGELDGWFSPEDCEATVERGVLSDKEFAAASRKGSVRGVIETLYRTLQQRWVLGRVWRNTPGHIPDAYAVPATYEFLTDDQALDWLTRQGYEDRVEQYFGSLPAERGPGRPDIGGRVQVRLGDLLEQVDDYAGQRGISRAQAIRELVSAGLEYAG